MAQLILEDMGEDPFVKPPVTPAQARKSFTTPGGGLVEDMGDEDPFRADIDFSAPDEVVRAEIAKLKPGSAMRKRAQAEWAEAKVKREAPKRNVVQDVGRQMARGLPIAGPFLPEITAKVQGAIHKGSGGKLYAPEEEVLAREDALNTKLDEDMGWGGTAAKVAGGLMVAGPVANWLLKAAGGLPAKSLASGGLGAGYAYTSGFGESRADTLGGRHEAGMERVPLGAGIGVVLPGGLRAVSAGGGWVADKVTPTLARANANVKAKLGIHASADETSAGLKPGAWAAALQMAANQLRRAGRSEADIRAQMAKMEEARAFHSSGLAQDVHAAVDLDPALADLVAHAARMDPAAKNTTNRFFRARQTGHVQEGSGPEGINDRWMGLPTKERMGPDLTVAQAEKKLGSRFQGGQDSNVVPMGQAARLGDDLSRLMQVKDIDHHGFQKTAEATDTAMAKAQGEASDAAYGATRKAGQGVDLNNPANYPKRPGPPTPGKDETLTEVMARWAGDAAGGKLATDVARQVTLALRKFMRGPNVVDNINTYDLEKRALDAIADSFMIKGQQSSKGINKEVGRQLRRMLNEMNEAVGRIETNGLGGLYTGARAQHAAAAQSRKMLTIGRDLLDPKKRPAALAAFRKAESDEHRKLIRFGFVDEMRRRMGELGHNRDKTHLFDKPTMDELIREIAPRTQTATGKEVMKGGAPAPLAQTPQRFGRRLDAERRMSAETPKQVLGGSPTAKNLQIDAQFQAMDRLEEARALWSQGGTMAMAGLRFLQGALNKIFGMRADTARAVARQMLTADPARRRLIMEDIFKRMDPDRFSAFLQALEAHQLQLLRATERQTATPEKK